MEGNHNERISIEHKTAKEQLSWTRQYPQQMLEESHEDIIKDVD